MLLESLSDIARLILDESAKPGSDMRFGDVYVVLAATAGELCPMRRPT